MSKEPTTFMNLRGLSNKNIQMLCTAPDDYIRNPPEHNLALKIWEPDDEGKFHLHDGVLEGIDFRGKKPIRKRVFHNCHFPKGLFCNIEVSDCIFLDCFLVESDWTDSNLLRVSFTHCQLSKSIFKPAKAKDVFLTNCQTYPIYENGRFIETLRFEK